MSYEFICELWPGGRFEQTLLRPAMLARWGRFTASTKRVRLRRRGGTYGPWILVADALSQIREITKTPRAGVRVITQRRSDKRELAITKVEAEDIPDLGCAPELEKIHHDIWTFFGAANVRSGGRGYCRFVDGTTTVSRHGYEAPDSSWEGAAEDVFPVNPNTPAQLAVIAHRIIEGHKAGKYKVRKVIWLDRMWTPAGGEVHYDGRFHSHVHDEVEAGVPCTPTP